MKILSVKISLCVLCILLTVSELPVVTAAEEFNVTADSLSAAAASLIEADSGDVIFEKNADVRLPMASTTKIMTALVAIENSELDSVVSVSDKAVGVEGSSVYLKNGEKLKMRELLYALMLASANDAAAAIAYEVAGGIDEFATLMNEKAESLGLRDTHFTNPHGLQDAEHYTTANDLAKLASHAMNNPVFREIVSTERHTIEFDNSDESRVVVNHNKLLLNYEGACGIKTGYTKTSGRCLVSAAERDGVTLIAVTLDAPDDWNDHRQLLDMGFEKYEQVTLAEVGEFAIDLPCIGGDRSYVRCCNTESLVMTLPKGTSIATHIEADRYFPAPVRAGDALASVVFYADGAEIARIPMFADHDVAESTAKLSIIERLLQFLGR